MTTIEKAQQIDNALTQIAPSVVFGGIARDTGFEVSIQDSLDAQALVEQRKADVTAAQNERDAKLGILANQTKLIVNGVKGNPAYGTDCALYEAMGFVPDSKRASGLTRGIPTPPPTTPAH